MQKEPESTGSFKDTTRSALDTHLSLPPSLGLSPHPEGKKRIKKHLRGRKNMTILSSRQYLAYENMRYSLY